MPGPLYIRISWTAAFQAKVNLCAWLCNLEKRILHPPNLVHITNKHKSTFFISDNSHLRQLILPERRGIGRYRQLRLRVFRFGHSHRLPVPQVDHRAHRRAPTGVPCRDAHRPRHAGFLLFHIPAVRVDLHGPCRVVLGHAKVHRFPHITQLKIAIAIDVVPFQAHFLPVQHYLLARLAQRGGHYASSVSGSSKDHRSAHQPHGKPCPILSGLHFLSFPPSFGLIQRPVLHGPLGNRIACQIKRKYVV